MHQDVHGRLKDLGVFLRTPLHIERYAGDAGYAWFEKDLPVPTKPPTMAESGGGGDYRTLHVHPAGFNAGTHGDPPNGHATCAPAGCDLEESVANLTVDGRRPATATIPVPDGKPIYRILIDAKGPRVV